MTYYPRKLEKGIEKIWDRGKIIVIGGPRRSGKTTLLKHFQERHGGTYISFDDIAEKRHFLSDPIGYIKPMVKEPIYLDEIQNLGEGGGKALKLVYDGLRPLKMMVSGSGAFELMLGIKSQLVGRAYFFTLLPLDFEEFLQWKYSRLHEYYKPEHIKLIQLLQGKKAEEFNEVATLERPFQEYSVLGGYPEAILYGKEELPHIVAAVIEEDILKLFPITALKSLEEVIERLAIQTCQPLTYSTLGINYQKAKEFINILIHSYVIDEVRPYYTNPLLEINKSPKVCFVDVGFRNALLKVFEPWDKRPDQGQVMENLIFRELLPYKPVKYWRSKNKAEVDFVVNNIPIEVKSGKGKPTRSLYSFIKRYNPPHAIVVSLEPWKRDNIYGVPPYFF